MTVCSDSVPLKKKFRQGRAEEYPATSGAKLSLFANQVAYLRLVVGQLPFGIDNRLTVLSLPVGLVLCWDVQRNDAAAASAAWGLK
jgi:hypothetical protein